MASTNHTSNYNLPQWVATDPFKREDFNDAFARIDTQIKNANTAASNASAAAADAAAGGVKIATGSYTGNKSTITVTTGFAPKFLIVITTGTNYGADILGAVGVSGFMLAVKRSDSNAVYTNCTFGSTGFIITDSSDRNLNANGMTYRYIAVG